MKETKTVQVYPDDDIVNATIEEYGDFGWEVVSNQRCQEFDGQTHDYFTGGSTKHYSTFNKLTLSREKDSPWYDEVTKMEREYNTLSDNVKSYKALKPTMPESNQLSSLVHLFVGVVLYMFFIIPGIIYSIALSRKKSKLNKEYQRQLAQYESVYPEKIKEAEAQQSLLRAQAQARISQKA